MGYANMVYAPGVGAFVERLARTGACGLIVPDLPQEEAPEVLEACDERDLALVPLVAPTTPPERLASIGARARGFLYTVSVVGTTGERAALSERFAEIVQRAKAATEVPVALGFGISSPEQAAQAADAGADGVIIGTRLVRAAGESADPAAAVGELVAALAAGVLTVTAGLVVWIVLWALDWKGFDSFMLAAAIILVGASLKILAGYLPGRRS